MRKNDGNTFTRYVSYATKYVIAYSILYVAGSIGLAAKLIRQYVPVAAVYAVSASFLAGDTIRRSIRASKWRTAATVAGVGAVTAALVAASPGGPPHTHAPSAMHAAVTTDGGEPAPKPLAPLPGGMKPKDITPIPVRPVVPHPAPKKPHAAVVHASRAKVRPHHRHLCVTPRAVAGLSVVQTRNAAAVVRASHRMGMGSRGTVVALSTALQESQLRNYANVNVPASMHLRHQAVGYDHDSVGLFQQRPNAPWGQGSWGTPRQLMTPQTSAGKFLGALRGIPGWRHMQVGRAAQAVQVSAFPDAYQQHVGHAIAIKNGLHCVK